MKIIDFTINLVFKGIVLIWRGLEWLLTTLLYLATLGGRR
jgi:hypothetical protein